MNPAERFNNPSDIIQIYSYTSNEVYQFTAFLTDFKDQRASNWSSQEVYGRMDPIYTYKNTTRKITLGFDIPAYDIDDATVNRNNLILLKSSVYPIYMEREQKNNYVLSTPPFHRIKFANLISSQVLNKSKVQYGLLGWIDGINYKPELESGFFTIGDNLIPKLFKLNFTFNIIHEHPLGFNKDHKMRHQPISATAGVGDFNIPAGDNLAVT